eukprot:TRINITY_DN591_c0_g1_i2.p1 TRINITY_DN591_c0_g1~~TRINITY_DN591_c0_g1_i2.p1  ORF type:complete len:336 (-),score=83.64 TRINITY_DN591_c0_g1_i2:30-1037(-)
MSNFESARFPDFTSLPIIVEDWIRDNRGIYSAAQMDKQHVVIDQNLVTGQNEKSSDLAVRNLVWLTDAYLVQSKKSQSAFASIIHRRPEVRKRNERLSKEILSPINPRRNSDALANTDSSILKKFQDRKPEYITANNGTDKNHDNVVKEKNSSKENIIVSGNTNTLPISAPPETMNLDPITSQHPKDANPPTNIYKPEPEPEPEQEPKTIRDPPPYKQPMEERIYNSKREEIPVASDTTSKYKSDPRERPRFNSDPREASTMNENRTIKLQSRSSRFKQDPRESTKPGRFRSDPREKSQEIPKEEPKDFPLNPFDDDVDTNPFGSDGDSSTNPFA